MSSDHAKVRLKRNTVALFGPVLAYEEVTRHASRGRRAGLLSGLPRIDNDTRRASFQRHCGLEL